MLGNLASKGPQTGAFEVVKTLFEATNGLYLPISFCAQLKDLLKTELSGSAFEMETDQVTALSQLVAEKVEHRAYGSGLPDKPPLATFIFFWLGNGNNPAIAGMAYHLYRRSPTSVPIFASGCSAQRFRSNTRQRKPVCF